MGKVDEVLRIREDYRDLLRDMRAAIDPTLEEEAVSGTIDENKVISVAQVLHELFCPDDEPKRHDLVQAIGLMDLLDVIGLGVHYKSRSNPVWDSPPPGLVERAD